MKKIYLLIFISIAALRVNGQACSDLFISEYIEGSSYNKIIEIFNPTSGEVDLSHYKLKTFFNGSDTAQYTLNLSGVLASGDVWVGCNTNADSTIADSANATNSFVINWNGNDAVALVNATTNDTIDVVGIIGDNPGSGGWDVGGGSTTDHTLVRNADVQQGTSDWSVGSTQWTVYSQDDFSHLGSHTMNPCSITNPSLFFTSDTLSVLESGGSFTISVGILNPNANATSVDVTVTGGSATMNDDYTFTSPQTITFDPNSSADITIDGTVVNDAISEGDETIDLSLSNATNQAIIIAGAMKVTIIDDDGLGISTNTGGDISLYPSIGSGLIHLSTLQSFSLQVIDVFGKEVKNIEEISGKQNLDLRNLSAGIYLLQFSNENENVMKKVLIKSN